MALNIPMPDLSGEGLIKGLESGSNLRYRQAQTQELRNKNMSEEFKRNLINQLMGNTGMPQGMDGSEPSINSGSPMNNINMDALKRNPMLRGLVKSTLGFDPLGGESENLQGVARDALDLKKLKDQYGENSEVYQNAKNTYDSQLDAKKDLRDLRARTKAGLKPGEKEFFDENTNEPLGKEVPFTAKERESEEGNILFNELYPHVYKGASPFSGEGSITRLQKAASNYKTDPKARKLFDDFLLANKMLAATVVNEASTLKARGTNTTYQTLKESLDAQDIPKIVTKLIKEYQIPASAQLQASMRYQKALSDARKKARTTVPATQKLFYDPEKQKQYENQDNTVSDSGDNKAATSPEDAYIEKSAANLIKVNPAWTADAIKSTMQETGLTAKQVINRLIDRAGLN